MGPYTLGHVLTRTWHDIMSDFHAWLREEIGRSVDKAAAIQPQGHPLRSLGCFVIHLVGDAQADGQADTTETRHFNDQCDRCGKTPT